MPPYGQGPVPPQQRYPPPPYGGGPPMPPQGPGYMGWGGGPPPQYGNPPPPHQWGGGPPQPGGGPMYRGPMSPDRSWNGYRKSASRKSSKKDDEDDRQQPPPGYGGGGGGGWGHPQQFHHYGGGGGGGGGWQGGPPMQPMYASQGTWTGSKSPPRGRRDIMRYDRADIDLSYMSSSVARGGPQDDDGASSSAGGSAKEKGRGSYKCGRCGVPKKGHVCPYQPKLKRRPNEPPPELRHAAVQVEMDEFMTLRRLNIKIQGFPESYATEPYNMGEGMVVGEPHPIAPPMPPDPMVARGGAIMPAIDEAPISNSSDVAPVPEQPQSSPRSSPTTKDTGFGEGELVNEAPTSDSPVVPKQE